MKRELLHNSIFDDIVLHRFLEEHGKLDHAITLWKHFYRNETSATFDNCPDLPKDLKHLLNENFVPYCTKVEKVYNSSDQTTTKLLIRLEDGNLIETVIMRYDRKNSQALSHRPRSTVCISSQVGCRMGCRFCATGTMGLIGHLTAGEIVEQLVHASRVSKIKNVVFMGMGEPLDNYENLVSAIRTMIHGRKFNMGPAHICVSTVGVIPRMKQILKDIPGVRLALSLHAPTQELRNEIVPSAKAYALPKLLSVVDDFLKEGRVMIEYILIGGVNDSEENARLLAQLFLQKNVVINLIPYNPTDVPEKYEPPSPESVRRFEVTVQSYGVFACVRRVMGQDIEGACGQLVVNTKNEEAASHPSDIEDMLKEKDPVRDESFNGGMWSWFASVIDHLWITEKKH